MAGLTGSLTVQSDGTNPTVAISDYQTWETDKRFVVK